jgi:hypothetical protein
MATFQLTGDKLEVFVQLLVAHLRYIQGLPTGNTYAIVRHLTFIGSLVEQSQ